MSNKTLALNDTLYQYLIEHSLREHPVLAILREETLQHPDVRMQIAPEQGQFMALLVKLIGAKQCLEIGTFTGYSALAVALALPEHGKLITCDINKEVTEIAQRFWTMAGQHHKIQLELAPALETLKNISVTHMRKIDFAFIDADKTNYDSYYEYTLPLMQHGGLIAFDNVLWNGRVADPSINDPDTKAIRALNKKLLSDTRVDISMVPIGDGVLLARKK